MPKRVLIVAGKMHYGGLETVVMNLVRLVDKEKIAFDFVLHYEEKGVFDDEVLSLGCKIYKWPRLKVKNLFKYIAVVLKFFREHAKEYDIVHGHLTSVGIIYLTIARLYGIKTTVIHAHSASTQNTPKGRLERFTMFPVRFCADYYFSCSQKAGIFCYGKRKMQGGGCRIIKNGILPDKFAFDPAKREKKRAELDIEEGRFVITHIGRFEAEKNHGFLAEVFQRILEREENALLLLIGKGSLEQSVREKAAALGIDEKIRFLGTRGDIDEILQASDLFVLPSFYEGLPVVAIEAQAAGLRCFFADTVTAETDVTGNCFFLSLESGAEAWALEILKNKDYERTDTGAKIRAAGYDMREQALWLQNFYLSHG